METTTLRDRLAERRRVERGDATFHAATVAARLKARPPDSVAAAEPSPESVVRAAETVRVLPFRPSARPAPSPVAANWSRLAWAIDHEGYGRGLAFDDGFKACLRALDVDERDIAILFRVGDECS
jgi:hypothetical protein